MLLTAAWWNATPAVGRVSYWCAALQTSAVAGDATEIDQRLPRPGGPPRNQVPGVPTQFQGPGQTRLQELHVPPKAGRIQCTSGRTFDQVVSSWQADVSQDGSCQIQGTRACAIVLESMGVARQSVIVATGHLGELPGCPPMTMLDSSLSLISAYDTLVGEFDKL
jgi:hypothetical protein